MCVCVLYVCLYNIYIYICLTLFMALGCDEGTEETYSSATTSWPFRSLKHFTEPSSLVSIPEGQESLTFSKNSACSSN